MGVQIKYVEPVILIYMTCINLSQLTGTQLILRKVCLNYFNSTYCDHGIKNQTNGTNEDMVQAVASQWSIYITVANLLPALISTFIYGFLSDIVGRKKMLVLPIIGEAISNVFYLINVKYFSLPLWYLLIANLISGVCGTFGTILMCVTAYISDTSEKEARTKRLTIMGIMTAFATILSSVCGGLILQKYGYVAIYATAMFFYCLLLIYVCFLKESLENLEETKIKKEELLKKMMGVFAVVCQERNIGGRKIIHLLLSCLFFLLLITVGFGSISTLFLKHPPLNFGAQWLGYFSAENSAIQIVGAALITLILIEKFDWKDTSIIIITAISNIAFMLCLTFSSNRWQVFASGICNLGIGMGVAAAQSSLTKLVSQEEQGRMCSFIANLEILCTLVGSAVFPSIYEKTVSISPNFVLFTMAVVSIIPLITAIMLRVYERQILVYVSLNDGNNVPSSLYSSDEY